MTTAKRQFSGRRRFLALTSAAGASLLAMPAPLRAHNNPAFKEVLLLTVEVSAEPLADQPFAAHSEPFGLDLPKKTIELVWRLPEGVTFGVAQGEQMHAEGLSDGATSRILRGGDIRIVDVQGATAPFAIEVRANVIDRSSSSS